MKEIVTIIYKPILYKDTTNSQSLSVSRDQISNITNISHILNRVIDIKREKSDIFHETNISNNYLCNLNGVRILFNDLNFIEISTQICILFGLDPSTQITDIKYKGEPLDINFNRYYNKLIIPNLISSKYVDIEELDHLIDSSLIASILRICYDCFKINKIFVIIPTYIYTITTNRADNNVISMLCVTKKIPQYFLTIVCPESYYIFNVCTDTRYRNQGLAKSLLINMLNDLIESGAKSFALSVSPDNFTAYKLYLSLGFEKIHSYMQNKIMFDLLALTI